MNKEDIYVGMYLMHRPTRGTYRVEGIGLMRTPTGQWVEAAHYRADPGTALYYRPLTDFGNFVELKGRVEFKL